MKLLLRPAPLAFAGFTVLGILFGQPVFAVLGVICWVGALALSSARKQGEKPHASTVSAEGRELLRPFEELRSDIARYVDEFGGTPRIAVIGKEALTVSDGLSSHARRLVSIHDDLARTLKGRDKSERQLKALRDDSESRGTTESVDLAVEAFEREIERYGDVEETMDQIVQKLREAESALRDVRTRLATAAASVRTDDLHTDELAGMVSRLKTLSSSLDEAEAMMEDRVR